MSAPPPARPGASLEAMFAPRIVAVVGASTDPAKLGHRALLGSLARGFQGRLYGVNPRFRGNEIVGVHCVDAVSAIDGTIDVALVAVPAGATLAAVRQLAQAGTRAAVLAASGFGEMGGPGSADEAAIADAAAEGGMRLLGPNGFGLFLAGAGLNLTGYESVPVGRCALVTQSGNVAIALFEQAAGVGLGFSCCIGLGNELDVSAGEVVRHLAGDDSCDAVALYLEGTGAGRGRGLLAGLGAARAAGKPVLVIRSGRSARGRIAAATHTGALGSDHRVSDAALRASRAVRVDSPEELVDALAAVIGLPGSSRRSRAGAQEAVFVVTDGGGDTVMTVDALHDAGIPLAQLSDTTKQRLTQLLPPLAPRVPEQNPVTLDTAGGLQDDPYLLARSVEAAADDPAVGTIVISGTFGGYRSLQDEELRTVDRLVALRAEHSIPVMVHSAFANGSSSSETVGRLRAAGIPVYPTARRLATALALALGLSRPLGSPLGSPLRPASQDRMRDAGAHHQLLPLEDSAELLRSVGASLPHLELVPANDRPALEIAAATVGFPVCVKVDHPDVAHKSETGAVALHVTRDLLHHVADDLESVAPPGARLLVMPMLAPGIELLLGLSHDPSLGAYVVVGRGGVTAELDPDVAIELAPVTPEAARRAWQSLRIAPLLSGWRGAPAIDLDALAALTAAISGLGTHEPAVELECNPVIAYPRGYAIADLRAKPVSHSQPSPDSEEPTRAHP